MSKYIDAEKLKAEIERRLEKCEKWRENCTTFGVLAASQAVEENKKFLEIIDSLQQEQPEIDLQKEYHNFLKSHEDWDETWGYFECIEFARHCFELGRLNARKED